MAITASVTVSNAPDFIAPVKSELWYRLTSSFTSLPNWRYYYDLYYSPGYLTPLTKIGRYKVPARPDTGDGIFSPHKVLSSYVTPYIDPLVNTLTDTPQMHCYYNIAPGLGYDPKLSYGPTALFPFSGHNPGPVINPVDYPNVVVPPGFVFGGGTYKYLEIITTQTVGGHGVLAGDTIVLDKNMKGYNSFYDGPQTVRSVGWTTTITNLNRIVLNVLYVADKFTSDFTSLPLYSEEGGIIDLVRMQAPYNFTKFAWNASRQYEQKSTDFSNLWKVNTTGGLTPPTYDTQHFLTQWDFSKYWKPIYLSNSETVNILSIPVGSQNTIRVRGYNFDTGYSDVATFSTTERAGAPKVYYTLQTAFYALTSGGLFSFPITHYDVSVGNPGCVDVFTPGHDFWSISARYKFVQEDCLYENVRICWLNRLGGYDYWNFSKERGSSKNISRTEFTKQLDWNYTIGDRQQSVLNVNVDQTFTANSDWLLDHEYAFLEDLLTSPDVYYLVETPWIPGAPSTPATVVKTPILITDTSWSSKTQLRERLYNLKISYKYSHKATIQYL